MVAKFLDDNKTNRHLKSGFALLQTSSILFNFYLSCQTLAKFSGLNPKGPYVILEKGKQNFFFVLAYSIKWASEIRKFNVAVVQQRLRNVQKSVMHMQRCFSASLNLLFFCRSPSGVAKNSLLLSSRNFATMVT